MTRKTCTRDPSYQMNMPSPLFPAFGTTPVSEHLYKQRRRLHSKHCVIFHQGDSAENFYRVNSGMVMVSRLLPNTQRQVCGFYTEGDFFGLTTAPTYSDTAVTLTDANIATFNRADLIKQSALVLEVLERAITAQEEVQNVITIVTKKLSMKKVASFIVWLSERQNMNAEKFCLSLPMSRLDIADYLGVTIETVSRRLTELKTFRVIKLPNRDSIQVLRYSELKSLADIKNR